MHFVDDIDFVARRGGAVMHAVDDLADVGHAGVGGGVHLHHVNMPAFHDGRAMLADAARFRGGPASAIRADAIHALGDDAGRGGFAGAADAGHHKSLRDPVCLERVLQRAHHGILAHQIGKGFWPVFAGKHAVGLAVRHEGSLRGFV